MNGLFENPYAGLLGKDEQKIAEQARMQGLLGLASSLFEAGAPSPVRQGLGQAFGRGIQSYQQGAQGTFDQALRSMMVRQQLEESGKKRKREEAIQTALQLPTMQEQVNALRQLGAYDVLGQMATAEKGVRQSGMLRQPGEVSAENPFAIYAESSVPGVAKLAKQYQKSYESGAIDDEKATARLGELGRMEQTAIEQSRSAQASAQARESAEKDRELRREQGTTEQAKASGFADIMLQSEKSVKDLESEFGNKVLPTTVTGFASSIPFVGGYAERQLMSKEQQRYKTAADAWIRSKLRWESGAAIGEKEMEDEYATYFPLPGDTPSRVADKAELRKTATENMIRNAGPLFKGQRGSSGNIGDIRQRFNLETPR